MIGKDLGIVIGLMIMAAGAGVIITLELGPGGRTLVPPGTEITSVHVRTAEGWQSFYEPPESHTLDCGSITDQQRRNALNFIRELHEATAGKRMPIQTSAEAREIGNALACMVEVAP